MRKQKFTHSKTLQDSLDTIVKRNLEKRAIVSFTQINDSYCICDEKYDTATLYNMGQSCFVQKESNITRVIDNDTYFIRCSENNCVKLNKAAYKILELFDGETNLWNIARGANLLRQKYTCETIDIESGFSQNSKYNIHYEYDAENLYHIFHFASILYELCLIEVKKVKCMPVCEILELGQKLYEKSGIKKTSINWPEESVQILLLGDKPGAASVGLLYLASFLKMNGIHARCLYNNQAYSKESLDALILDCIKNLQPKFVGLSMKWFPHISRILAMADMIKKVNTDIKVIVGGDTASYYASQVIENANIDYVICGDGETALLQICEGNSSPVNTYVKRHETVMYPVQYVENNGNSNIYLRPLDEIVLDISSFFYTALYIPTSKGCVYNCPQCGGNKNIQKSIFKRTAHMYVRDYNLVRRDILCTINYTTTYMFSVNSNQENYEYFKAIWDGLYLSEHYCAMFHYGILDDKLVDLAVKKFKYVRFAIDICSMSQEHRKRINKNTCGKEQVMDAAIIHFFNVCEQYDNCEVDIYTIAGMPLFEEADIEEEKRFLDKLKQYRCFHGIEWGRLHSQPGAELVAEAEKYGMKSAAQNYQDFLKYSEMNYNSAGEYPVMAAYHYPYITYQDDAFMQKVLMHYMELGIQIQQWRIKRRAAKLISQEITYGGIRDGAEQIAGGLLQMGIKKGDRVLVLIKDRIKLSLTIWAIIKAGGVYIPLDVVHHIDLAEQLAKSTKAFCIITDMDIKGSSVISINELLMKKSVVTNYEKGETQDVLYGIYTSGSTGSPKLVMIQQLGVLNYTYWRIKNYGISNEDVVLQPLSEAFDGFASNFYTSLLAGALLIMPSQEQIRNPENMKNLIYEYKITHISLLPFLYDMLLQDSRNRLASIRSIVLGGEASTANLVSRSKKLYPDILMINEYGPTENSIAASACIGLEERNINCIGRPIDGVVIVVRDNMGNQVPTGESGEICIAGRGLYCGYYPNVNHDSYYKTGDTGKYDEDGNLYFLGRKNRLCKKSGIQVNLDQNEEMLLECGMLKEAAEILKNDQIYAYIVLKEGYTLEMIKSVLKNRIPTYLLPSAYIELNELPRLPGGKTDYLYLEKIERCDRKAAEGFDMYQELLIDLWQKELGHNQFGLDENFFDIGGNSLMIMKVFNALNQKFPDKFTPTDFFVNHTVRTFAEYMKEKLS